MADGKIEIDTSINTKELETGVKNAENILAKLGKSSTLKGIAGIGTAISGAGAAVQLLGSSFKAVSATIKDLTDTYKTQAKAETQLETAAKNNPYLDEASVRQLKKYASGLQEISTLGDEQLLPMMAQLASAGRTQQEIMDIMSAAADVAASGAMSLESAVQGLNASYSGQVGLLGKTLPMLKNLTAEELKQGKAVKEVAKAYGGMAKETAKATGSAEQLKNAWGDLKENLGRGLENALAPVRKLFTNILSDINNIISRSRELSEANENISNGTATTADFDVKIEKTEQQIAQLEKLLEKYKQVYSETGIDNGIGEVTKELQWQREILRQYNVDKGKLVATQMTQAELERKAAEEAERNAAAQKEAADAKKRMNDLAISALEAYNKSVDSVEREITAREQLGDYISEGEKMEMRYEARRRGYIDLLVSAEGAISGNLEREKETREKILELAKELAEYENSPEGKADKYAEEGRQRKETVEIEWKVKKDDLKTAREEIKNLHELLVQNESLSVDQRIALEEKYRDAVEEINRQIEEGDRELNERRTQNLADMVDKVREYADQAVSIMKDAANLMIETVRYQSAAEQAELELKYRKGEMSEEEYNEKVTESKRKAAKEQYKIQMVQWAASILQATANVAEGVTKALAQNGWPLGAVMAGLAAAAGAVQIATIVASKPTPPSFATGGIVPGNSYSGDRVQANVNSGEMILNAAQQRSLWEAANGRGAGGGTNVVINNSASNLVSARPQITEDRIGILIDARVNEGLQKGKYDQSLAMANEGMDGDTWGI